MNDPHARVWAREAAWQHRRDALVLRHQGLVRSIASRFRDRGEPLEDLIQVGTIGLINALDRWRPDRQTLFSTFATPTIRGEIERYFRDKTGLVVVPRRLRQLFVRAERERARLQGERGRMPTLSEVAARLSVSEDEVREAIRGALALGPPLPLDARPNESGVFSPVEVLGGEDPALTALTTHAADLRRAMEGLEARQKRVLRLRFFEGLSQRTIAERMNVSQMQVSRLQRSALTRLRLRLADGDDETNPEQARKKNRT